MNFSFWPLLSLSRSLPLSASLPCACLFLALSKSYVSVSRCLSLSLSLSLSLPALGTLSLSLSLSLWCVRSVSLSSSRSASLMSDVYWVDSLRLVWFGESAEYTAQNEGMCHAWDVVWFAGVGRVRNRERAVLRQTSSQDFFSEKGRSETDPLGRVRSRSQTREDPKSAMRPVPVLGEEDDDIIEVTPSHLLKPHVVAACFVAYTVCCLDGRNRAIQIKNR